MHRTLRLKLTVVNAAALSALSLLFLAGAYLLLPAGPAAWVCLGVAWVLVASGAGVFLADYALARARTIGQGRQNFLADAAHEFKTPLTVIQANLDVVLSNPADTVASQGKWLGNIGEETAAMTRLVDSLLFLARVDAHRQPLNRQPFSLNETVNRAVAPFEPVAAAKGVLLETSGAAVPVGCYGDENSVRQLIGILVDNAIRHTPPGGRVSVYLSRPGPQILLAVADTGEGIEVQHLEKIFDRFYQAGRPDGKGSSGLGLAIAKWIAESHGGAIAVKSRPGEGSVFTVELPGAG